MYKGLVKHIVIKYDGAQYLPNLTDNACHLTSTTQTLYILRHKFNIHFEFTHTTRPLQTIPMHMDWYSNLSYPTLTPSQKAN